MLAWERNTVPQEKLSKLEEAWRGIPGPCRGVPPSCRVALAAAAGTVLAPDADARATEAKTLEALLAWLLAETEQQPVLFIVEDLHWVDPSTLEWLSLVVEQSPTARLYGLFTCRPEFTSPWPIRTHLTSLTLSRLPRPQAARLHGVTGGKPPRRDPGADRGKTDGVPLFVEELTKTVLESGLLREIEDAYELAGPLPPLAIPTTLQDSLMARLDRLAAVKAVAQLGATIGRQFGYELLRAVSPWTKPRCSRSASARRGGAGLSTGRPSPGDVSVQTCPDSGRGVSVPAQEHPAAVPSAHCSGLGGAVSKRPRPNPNCWRITTRRRASATSDSVLAAGWPACPRALGQSGGYKPPHQGAGGAQDPARQP